MKFLILTQYFSPEPADKFIDLTRSLVKLGHDVQVLTSFPCYPQGKIYEGYSQSICSEEMFEGALLTRVPQFPDHSRSVIRRCLYYLSFALSAATIGLWRSRSADVLLVYQSALPVGLAAWVIGLVRRIPIVLDVVDLWPESVVASGMITNRWILATIRSVARFVYRRAARINVITEGYRDNLIRLGVPADRINVVHCWPGGGKCDPVEPDPEFARQCGLDKKCNILFAGNIGPCQQLETVIGAAELLYDTPHVQFVIAGGGVEYSRLEELVRQRSIGNVVFLGWRSPSDVAQLYAHSDLLLVHLRSDPMSMISIPSKTFAYMASGRPLLMAVEGEAAELVMRHECGIVAKPSDPAALAAAVREFLGMPGKLRRHMGCAAREAYLQHYSSTAQVAKVIATVDLAVGKRLAA